MNSRTSLLAICTLVLALFGGAWWALRSDGPGDAPAPGGTLHAPQAAPEVHPVLPRGEERPRERAPEPIAPSAPQVLSASGPALAQAAGRLVDRTGRPIPGAVITSFLSGPGQPYRTRTDVGTPVTSTADGRFHFATLPSARELGIEVVDADHAPVVREPFRVASGEQKDLGDIVLDDGMLLTGTVTDPEGKPIEGARVALTDLLRGQRGAGDSPALTALTNADGNYGFPHLALRQYQVEASGDGFAPVGLVLSLVLGTTDGRWRQDFQLELADSSLLVQVIDNLEQPVPDLPLRVSQRQRSQNTYRLQAATTGPDGRFRLDDLASGSYDVELQSSRFYLGRPLQMLADGLEHVVRVQPALAVAGQLRSSTTPPDDFRVRVRPDGRTGAGLLDPATLERSFHGTQPAGSFTIDGLRPGSYRFEVKSEGYADTSSSDVILGPDVPVASLIVYLLRGGSVSGRLQPPVADALVELRDSDYDPSLSLEATFPTPPAHDLTTRTGADGRFKLTRIPPADYTLSVHPPEGPPLHVRDVHVADEIDTDVGALTLPRGGSLSGNVLGPDGRPRAGVRIGATSDSHQEQEVTDAEGAFHMLSLPPGEYEIVATPGNLWEALQFEGRAHATVLADQDASVALTLVERNAKAH